MVLVLCLSCAGCGRKPAATEVHAESVNETVPTTEAEESVPETDATEETNPYADMPCKNPRTETGYKTGDTAVTVYDCRMYTLDTGYTRFEVDYQTAAGLNPVVFAHVGESEEPAYWHELDAPTTSEKETLVFEMETDLLNQSYGPDIHFRDENDEPMGWILIYHTEQELITTEGNPVGEALTLKAATSGKVKVQKAAVQALDNGYVRFTIEVTAPEDRYISFYNPPKGDHFMCISAGTTYGGEETIVVDVKREDAEGLSEVNLNFFNGDKPVARVNITGLKKFWAE